MTSPSPMLTPRMPAMVPTSVAVVSSLVIRYMRIMTSRASCNLNTMTGIVAATQASVRRSVACQRSGVGASSRRKNSTSSVVRVDDRVRAWPSP